MNQREPELHAALEQLEDEISYLEDIADDLGERKLIRLVRLLARTLRSIQKHVRRREEPTG